MYYNNLRSISNFENVKGKKIISSVLMGNNKHFSVCKYILPNISFPCFS